jgi:hypothetical protein
VRPGELAHVSRDGSQLLGDERIEDYGSGGLFLFTAGNAPADAHHLQRLLAAKA